MKDKIKIQMGDKAKEEIEKKGFSAALVKMMLGASGGPKWLILSELDKYLLNDFFVDRKEALHLLGSSIGSFRFACYAHPRGVDALRDFRDEYIYMGHAYQEMKDVKKGRELNTKLSVEIVEKSICSSPADIREIINNPVYKLNFITTACKGLGNSELKLPLAMGMAAAGVANVLSRKTLQYFFDRSLFYTDSCSPFFHLDDLPTERIALNEDNFTRAILASGSIPLATYGFQGLSEKRPKRVYRDGGLIDYHFDIPTSLDEGIILYPHFYDFALPGWFDKLRKSRQVQAQHYERIMMISPSTELIEKLPYKKIPDRNDFKKMDFKQRVKYWQQVVDMGKYMAEGFSDYISTAQR